MLSTSTGRRAKLFRNGRSQAIRIPKEFEMPGEEVVLHKEGNRLIVEPANDDESFFAMLASWEPIDDEFPDIDSDLIPADDVEI